MAQRDVLLTIIGVLAASVGFSLAWLPLGPIFFGIVAAALGLFADLPGN